MNREEARRLSVENGSNEPPPEELLEAIKAACERGRRSTSACKWPLNKKQEHWLIDAGFTVVTVDPLTICGHPIVVRIEW